MRNGLLVKTGCIWKSRAYINYKLLMKNNTKISHTDTGCWSWKKSFFLILKNYKSYRLGTIIICNVENTIIKYNFFFSLYVKSKIAWFLNYNQKYLLKYQMLDLRFVSFNIFVLSSTSFTLLLVMWCYMSLFLSILYQLYCPKLLFKLWYMLVVPLMTFLPISCIWFSSILSVSLTQFLFMLL